jgi:hypothetical protein
MWAFGEMITEKLWSYTNDFPSIQQALPIILKQNQMEHMVPIPLM